MHVAAADTLAGLARCALAQGQLEQAHHHVAELWNYLNDHGPEGLEMPVWAYQTCAEIFEALGDEVQARAAVEAGHRELIDLAGKISDPEWRKTFLENVPEHHAITEMWDRRSE